MGSDARIVVVTGATGGLGRVAARRFAESGDRIAAVGRSADELESLVRELSGGADRHASVVADVTDAADAERAAREVRERMAPAAVVVHAVGGYRGETGMVEAPPAELEAMFDAHVRSTWNVLRAFVPDVRAAAGGRIVTFSSTTVATPGSSAAAYAAAKAGLETLTLSVAKELAKTDATANVVVLRAIGRSKRTEATPEEIAETLLWLCSPAAAAVNGARIAMTGRA